jgi:hypothetical protein
MTVFSFSDYNDEHEEDELPYDDYLTVKAFLEMHFGKETGGAVYAQLERMARKQTKSVGGFPGIVFNDDGGEFVSFEMDPNQEDEFGVFDEEGL